MLPSVLLSVFLAGFIFMVIAGVCVPLIFRIARRALPVIRQKDVELYRDLVGNAGHSWIERRADSIRDFGLWWRLYQALYRDERAEAVVGKDVVVRFIRYFRLMFISFVSAIILTGGVIITGFILASRQ